MVGQLSHQQIIIRWYRWASLTQSSCGIWCTTGLNSWPLTYINEVATVISDESKINLFADDIALYRVIKSPSDYNCLQTDVNAVGHCISQKHLTFNVNKCKVMLISKKKSLFYATTKSDSQR